MQKKSKNCDRALKTGKSKARSITRAHILLMAWEGEIDKAIAQCLRVNVSTVERTRARYVEGGIELAVQDRPHPPKQRKLDGQQIELSVLSRQCLSRRIADVQKLSQEIACWQSERNSQKESVNWRFKTTDARKKMGRLYPPVLPCKVGLPDH